MEERFEVVWPLGESTQKAQALAPRLKTLEGKTIGGLYNGAFYFEKTWPTVKQALSRRFPNITFVDWEKFGLFHNVEENPALKALPERLKQYKVDAVISGRGC